MTNNVAVRCMPGMLVKRERECKPGEFDIGRVIEVRHTYTEVAEVVGTFGVQAWAITSVQVDTDDAGTVGCLLAQAREAWPCNEITVGIDNQRGEANVWVHMYPASLPTFRGHTLGETLVAVIKAAPHG